MINRLFLVFVVVLVFALAGVAHAQDAIHVDQTGNVGVGTSTPQTALHVLRDGDAPLSVLRVENSSTGSSAGTRFEVVGHGQTWLFDVNSAGNFSFNKQSVLGVEFLLRGANDPGGLATMTVAGSISATNVTFTSSREAKSDFAVLSGREVLDKVAALDIQSWRFEDDPNGVRHIGPVAEQFAAAFPLGGSDQQLSVIDLNGVALAAIQGLDEKLTEVQIENDALRAELRDLRELVEQLRAAR